MKAWRDLRRWICLTRSSSASKSTGLCATTTLERHQLEPFGTSKEGHHLLKRPKQIKQDLTTRYISSSSCVLIYLWDRGINASLFSIIPCHCGRLIGHQRIATQPVSFCCHHNFGPAQQGLGLWIFRNLKVEEMPYLINLIS